MMYESFAPDGRRMAYYRTPTSAPRTEPTVLLLHGLAADHDGLLPLVQSGWPDADVVAPDLPGFGNSDPLPVNDLASYAAEIDRLASELGLSGVTVIGHSLGATIALVLGARRPAWLQKLVLFSPVTSDSGPRTWPVRVFYAIGALLPPRAARFWFLSHLAVYLSDAFTLVSRDRAVRRRIRIDDYRTAAQASPRAVVEIYRSVRETPFADHASRIAVPTALVGSRRDALAGPRTLNRLQSWIPRSSIRIADRAGHLLAVEDPARAASTASDALAILRSVTE